MNNHEKRSIPTEPDAAHVAIERSNEKLADLDRRYKATLERTGEYMDRMRIKQ